MVSARIAHYKFEDARATNWSIVVIHVLMAALLLVPDDVQLATFGRGHLCLLIALMFSVAQYYYDWLNQSINYAIIGFYLALLVFDFLTFGVPDVLLPISGTGPPSKGFMLVMVVYALPTVYVGLRVVAVGQLIYLVITRSKLR
ncbi:hypothetical protein [Lewinella sp. 4G2]|uniref:hypothetical protein n=1 Tax=Lewinella sp. 4G2 TaxID=1803372 RepID=UPI0012FA3BF3|nr:hypothetical protein [Lewinella sp. 4G2]